MGTMIEINDTLQLTTSQGFPASLLNLAKHRKKPVELEAVADRIFEFKDKPSARMFQLDPVRVYYVHNIDGKWLFWGRVLIQTLSIRKNRNADGTPIVPGTKSDPPAEWLTSGTYKIMDIYPPDYQEAFTRHEAPPDRNYFIPGGK